MSSTNDESVKKWYEYVDISFDNDFSNYAKNHTKYMCILCGQMCGGQVLAFEPCFVCQTDPKFMHFSLIYNDYHNSYLEFISHCENKLDDILNSFISELQMAFTMGCHIRLGEKSILNKIHETGIYEQICNNINNKLESNKYVSILSNYYKERIDFSEKRTLYDKENISSLHKIKIDFENKLKKLEKFF